ncbi:MAG TPA: hypothetical protein VGM52_17430 [Herbaspirillum sp.]
MNHFAIPAVILSVATLLSSTAQAMEIQQFDNMDDRDQAAYVGLLVQGAETVLTNEGRTDLATQVDKLFLTKPAGDKMALGMTEFERNLVILRENDARNAISRPSDPRLEVEDVMFLTLQKNHIGLPDSFFTVNSNFRPKQPLKN